MRKKIILTLLVVFAGGVISGLFIPQLLKRERLPSSPTDFLCHYLSLSESQKKKMESLDQTFYVRVEKIRTETGERRAELGELFEESSLNQEKIRVKVNEISSLQAEFLRETIIHMVEIRALLTPEQQAKFFSLIKKRLYRGRPWMRHKKGRF